MRRLQIHRSATSKRQGPHNCVLTSAACVVAGLDTKLGPALNEWDLYRYVEGRARMCAEEDMESPDTVHFRLAKELEEKIRRHTVQLHFFAERLRTDRGEDQAPARS